MTCSDFVFDSHHDAQKHYWYLPELERVAGASTQWLAFRFRLNAMRAHSPGSHFAVALGARLGFDAAGRPITISGRGFTLGDTSLAQPAPGNLHALRPGFGGARGAQIESFWTGGNFLFRDTGLLPDGLSDGHWYRMRLHVNDERWIALEIDDDAGPTMRACVQDRIEHPVEAASGVLIALGRGPDETGPWSAEFRNIACGWF